jgi:hypothetical protein
VNTRRVFTAAALCLIALASSLFAQTQSAMTTPATPFPEQFLGGVVNFNQQTTPQITGDLAYAVRVNNSGLYNYNAIDITSVSRNPFRLQTAPTSGVAQYVRTVGGFNLFALGTAGAAFSTNAVGAGTDAGAAFSGGMFATKAVGKGWFMAVTAKVLYTTTGGVQYPIGIGFGWGR